MTRCRMRAPIQFLHRERMDTVAHRGGERTQGHRGVVLGYLTRFNSSADQAEVRSPSAFRSRVTRSTLTGSAS